MAVAVYALCTLTSLTAAVLLARGWATSRSRLLFWSSLGFAFLAVNNVILFVDKVIVADVDLSLARGATGLAGLAVLLFGLVGEEA